MVSLMENMEARFDARLTRGKSQSLIGDLVLQMQFMLLFSRQGKLRLQKWYVAHPDKLKKKITRELITTILARKPKMSSFLEWKDVKVVYKRYVIEKRRVISRSVTLLFTSS